MKLATFIAPEATGPIAGLVTDDRITPMADGGSVLDVLAGKQANAGGAADGNGMSGGEAGAESFSLADVTLLAPIQRPGTVYAIGLNYAEHAAETGAQRPEAPIVFVKVAGSIAPPGGPIICPEVVRRLDYEGELTIVMGREGKISGYCIANDVTARDLQGREPQWTRAKGADTFCPIGPWVTTAEEVPDPEDLRLRTWVNGELRQDSGTSDLIFGCEELVRFISQTCTLHPGDLILTGTPSGVGMGLDPPQFLQSGDVVRIEIEGLGVIEQRVG